MRTATVPFFLFLTTATLLRAQGTFVFDQQSSTESTILEGSADIQLSQPMGQSFTPALTEVGFIRLILYNGILGDTSPATVQLTLRSADINGPVLATSASVVIPGGAFFIGPVDFIFSTQEPLVPGTTYCFQPVVTDNQNLGLMQGSYGYGGGTAFFQGVPDSSNRDFWFREGLIVPEPSAHGLLLFSLTCAILTRPAPTRRPSSPPRGATHLTI